MATKNLARTVIEGGRSGHYQSDVDFNERSDRRAVKRFCGKVANDIEEYEDLVVPKRQPVYPDFADKLRPVYRFLDSHLGEPWDDVRSLVFARFDTRTTPGRHVLFDHLLREVRTGPEVGYERYARWYVDENGLLQRKKEPRGTRYRAEKPIPYASIVSWLKNRKVGRCGERLVWFVPANPRARIRVAFGPRPYAERVGRFATDLLYCEADNKGEILLRPLPPRERHFSWLPTHEEVRSYEPYRQAGLLSNNEEAFFRSLPERAQKILLAAAPQKQAA